MKRFKFIGVILLINMLSVCHVCAQETDIFEGIWLGDLKVNQDVSLRIAFEIKADGKTYSATLNSIDQSAYGIPVETITIKDRSLMLNAASLNCSYEGYLLVDGLMKGTFKQGGASLELNLHKVDRMPGKKVLRPQEPKKPYPYVEENVKYENKEAGVSLAGTLTKPSKKGVFPAVVLISGSGANDRDELVFGHRVFLVLADYLTRQGFAVLRFDDRGVGASEGDFSKATTPDFVNDVEAGVNYLKTRKDIDFSRLGLIGHSEGGLVAPMLAAKSDDIKFMVLLAAPGVRGEELLYTQNEMILKQRGAPANVIDEQNALVRKMYKCILDEKDIKVAKKRVQEIIRQNILASPQASQLDDNRINGIVQQQSALVTPWFRCFLEYDPVSSLKKVKCPVLALNGEKDIQVESKENLAAIEKALSKAKVKYKTVELEGLNHLFLKCETGDVLEYPTLKTSFSVKAMGIIHNWIIEL